LLLIVTEIRRQTFGQSISQSDQRLGGIISAGHVFNFNGSYATLSDRPTDRPPAEDITPPSPRCSTNLVNMRLDKTAAALMS